VTVNTNATASAANLPVTAPPEAMIRRLVDKFNDARSAITVPSRNGEADDVQRKED
jgi:hypothetical protein